MKKNNELQKYYIDYYLTRIANKVISGEIDINSSNIVDKIEKELKSRSLKNGTNPAANPFSYHNSENDNALNYNRTVSIIVSEYLKKLKRNNQLNLASNENFVKFINKDNIVGQLLKNEEISESIRNSEGNTGIYNIQKQIQILDDICTGKSELLIEGIKATMNKNNLPKEFLPEYIKKHLFNKEEGLQAITNNYNCRTNIRNAFGKKDLSQEEISNLFKLYLIERGIDPKQIKSIEELSEYLAPSIFGYNEYMEEPTQIYKPKTK